MVGLSWLLDWFFEKLYVLGRQPIQEPDGVVLLSRDDTLEPAIEIMLHEEPREIERSTDENLVFRDFKPCLQIGRHFSVVSREDWSYESYENRDDIQQKYYNIMCTGLGWKTILL